MTRFCRTYQESLPWGVNRTVLEDTCGLYKDEFFEEHRWTSETCPDAAATWDTAANRLEDIIRRTVVYTREEPAKTEVFPDSPMWSHVDGMRSRWGDLTHVAPYTVESA